MSRPKVDDARALGKRDDLDRVVILFVGRDGEIGYASYGRTRRLCSSTRILADALYDRAVAWISRARKVGP